jgi:uroporphyrinogen decarboxylase
MKTWLSFFAELSSRLSSILEFDFVYIWDDMSYKNGPLISPQMVEEFLIPYNTELIQQLKQLGYKLFMWDSDGDPRKIIPSFVGAGINAFLPCEINSGVEPLELQKKYGKTLSLCGGIDKRALARSKSNIHEEVMRKVPELLRHGGYVPAIDHGIPNDVPFENYCYFLELVRNLGKEITPELSG